MKVWILEGNLRPMVEFASYVVGYEFDDIDWDAVALGLRDTDVEKEAWFEYPLVGDRSLSLKVALSPGEIVAWVWVDTDPELETRLMDAAVLMADYSLSR